MRIYKTKAESQTSKKQQNFFLSGLATFQSNKKTSLHLQGCASPSGKPTYLSTPSIWKDLP